MANYSEDDISCTSDDYSYVDLYAVVEGRAPARCYNDEIRLHSTRLDQNWRETPREPSSSLISKSRRIESAQNVFPENQCRGHELAIEESSGRLELISVSEQSEKLHQSYEGYRLTSTDDSETSCKSTINVIPRKASVYYDTLEKRQKEHHAIKKHQSSKSLTESDLGHRETPITDDLRVNLQKKSSAPPLCNSLPSTTSERQHREQTMERQQSSCSLPSFSVSEESFSRVKRRIFPVDAVEESDSSVENSKSKHALHLKSYESDESDDEDLDGVLFVNLDDPADTMGNSQFSGHERRRETDVDGSCSLSVSRLLESNATRCSPRNYSRAPESEKIDHSTSAGLERRGDIIRREGLALSGSKPPNINETHITSIHSVDDAPTGTKNCSRSYLRSSSNRSLKSGGAKLCNKSAHTVHTTNYSSRSASPIQTISLHDSTQCSNQSKASLYSTPTGMETRRSPSKSYFRSSSNRSLKSGGVKICNRSAHSVHASCPSRSESPIHSISFLEQESTNVSPLRDRDFCVQAENRIRQNDYHSSRALRHAPPVRRRASASSIMLQTPPQQDQQSCKEKKGKKPDSNGMSLLSGIKPKKSKNNKGLSFSRTRNNNSKSPKENGSTHLSPMPSLGSMGLLPKKSEMRHIENLYKMC